MPAPLDRLLLASGNAKKLAELRGLLEPLGIALVTPEDIGGLPEVIEDRPTFAGNSAKKATSAALHTGLWALADDSGLEVAALDNHPGVRSARFHADHGRDPGDDVDAANRAELLAQLQALPDAPRDARFQCALALAQPDGEIVAEFAGKTHGRIIDTERGGQGFGYDPLFEFAEPGSTLAGSTFAELTAEQKASISHRGRALANLARWLERVSRTPG